MLRTLPHLALGTALVSSACGANITSKPGDIGQQGGAAGTGGQGGAGQMAGASLAAGGASLAAGGASIAAGGARPMKDAGPMMAAAGQGATGGVGGKPPTGGAGAPGRSDASLEPFPCFAVKPLVPAITDFSGTDAMGRWGDPLSFAGGVYSYGGSNDAGNDAGMDLAAAVDMVAHNFHITGRVTTDSGFGLYFDECADASDYRGITFKLSGTITGGLIRFVPTVNETTPIDPVNMIGSCSFTDEATKYTECVNPGVTVTASGKVTVLWDALTGGQPRATVNPAQLRGLQWELVWVPGLTPYAVDLTLDDVAFVTAADAAVEASADATDATDATDGGTTDTNAVREASTE